MKILEGSQFEIKVWNELKKIPFGETRSYKQIAINIGHPKAARAVANACGKNPKPIIIPCHRVIRTNGKIGGFSAPGGSKTKQQLLAKEGVIID